MRQQLYLEVPSPSAASQLPLDNRLDHLQLIRTKHITPIAHGYTYAPIMHGRNRLVNIFVRVKSAELLDGKIPTSLHLDQLWYKLPGKVSWWCFTDF
jgi:hypothetical protein